MKNNTFIRLIKFGVVGGSGVVLNQVIFIVATDLCRATVIVSSPIAIICAIISNFYLNYCWTWSDRKSSRLSHIFKNFAKFFISSGTTAFIFNYLPLLFMVNSLQLDKHISNIIGIGIASIANFLISHYWAFSIKNEQQITSD